MLFIGIVIGVPIGFFICGLFASGKISDIERFYAQKLESLERK